MKKRKVKYNREEYRKEYLNSREWKLLRSVIMDTSPDCQCCGDVKARDVHHMVYRNIIDVKVSDLLPVCRECHKFIHKAIDDNYIPKSGNTKRIKGLTINILNDRKYAEHRKWLGSKHFLKSALIESIKGCGPNVIKKINGIKKAKIWIEDLPRIKFTGRQVKKIESFIESDYSRKRLNRNEKRARSRNYNHSNNFFKKGGYKKFNDFS